MLLMQGVLRCFAALFSHLLSLLACLSASGLWHSIVGDAATLVERLSQPKSWPMTVVRGLYSRAAQSFGAPPQPSGVMA